MSSEVDSSWSTRTTLLYLLAVAFSALASLVVTLERSRPPLCCANEAAAIATLKHIASLQERLQSTAGRDLDGDGRGEHGFLVDLAALSPWQPELGTVSDGIATLHGYHFQVLLPGPNGGWVPEHGDGGSGDSTIDTAAAERQWICYAWPAEPGHSGNRTFLVTWLGDVIATESRATDEDVRPLPGRSGLELRDGRWQPLVVTPDCRGDVWTVMG
jgi:hypothetical protein